MHASANDLKRLSDHDLLTMLTGSRRRTAEPGRGYQAEALAAMAGFDLHELQHALQLTPAATKRLGAALELHRRLLRKRAAGESLRHPDAVARLMQAEAVRDHECLWCVCLDSRSNLMGEPVLVTKGDIDGTEAGPRVFFRNALRRAACSAIAVHNHPSGDPSESAADVAVTRRLVDAGKAVDLPLVDHLIITAHGGFTSLRREHPELWA